MLSFLIICQVSASAVKSYTTLQPALAFGAHSGFVYKNSDFPVQAKCYVFLPSQVTNSIVNILRL